MLSELSWSYVVFFLSDDVAYKDLLTTLLVCWFVFLVKIWLNVELANPLGHAA